MKYRENSGGRPLDSTEVIGLHDNLSHCQLLMKDFAPQRYMMSSHSSTNRVSGYIRNRLGPNLTTGVLIIYCLNLILQLYFVMTPVIQQTYCVLLIYYIKLK